MNETKATATRVACALCAALASMASAAVLAQGADDLYEVTVKMEMTGMPMAMPATTQRMCVKKGGGAGDVVPRQENCKVTDAKRSGSRLTFAMACTGRDPMTGTGDFTYAGDGYTGQIRMQGKMEGMDMTMTQSVAGRRVGSCTAP